MHYSLLTKISNPNKCMGFDLNSSRKQRQTVACLVVLNWGRQNTCRNPPVTRRHRWPSNHVTLNTPNLFFINQPVGPAKNNSSTIWLICDEKKILTTVKLLWHFFHTGLKKQTHTNTQTHTNGESENMQISLEICLRDFWYMVHCGRIRQTTESIRVQKLNVQAGIEIKDS